MCSFFFFFLHQICLEMCKPVQYDGKISNPCVKHCQQRSGEKRCQAINHHGAPRSVPVPLAVAGQQPAWPTQAALVTPVAGPCPTGPRWGRPNEGCLQSCTACWHPEPDLRSACTFWIKHRHSVWHSPSTSLLLWKIPLTLYAAVNSLG